jgi:hypothetical protein
LISRPLRFNLAQGGEQTGHGRTSPFARTMPEPFCGTGSLLNLQRLGHALDGDAQASPLPSR